MKLLIILFIFSTSAFAQEAEILTLVDQIEDEVRFRSHDRRTLLLAKRNLQHALDTLRGNPSPIPPRRTELSCIDRDRDGRDPYILGYLDPRTLSTSRIPNTNVGSIHQCQNIVANSINLSQGATLTCITRDNDGREPWAPVIIKDGRVEKRLNSLGSLNNCLSSISQSIANRFAVSLCVTRDNDGRAPFMRISYELSSGRVNNGATYNTLQECENSRK